MIKFTPAPLDVSGRIYSSLLPSSSTSRWWSDRVKNLRSICYHTLWHELYYFISVVGVIVIKHCHLSSGIGGSLGNWGEEKVKRTLRKVMILSEWKRTFHKKRQAKIDEYQNASPPPLVRIEGITRPWNVGRRPVGDLGGLALWTPSFPS